LNKTRSIVTLQRIAPEWQRQN